MKSNILCACGCGEFVDKAKFPSQQRKYINFHQHRGIHNGNYRGGKIKTACPICGTTFYKWPSWNQVTCRKDECYRKWVSITVKARGNIKVKIKCSHCGKELIRFPSQIHERNYCNRYCLAADNPKNGAKNGNWQGGRDKFIKDQTLLRDNYRCVICGFDLVVDVHHITPRTENGTNEFSNLITLCPNHHKLADLGFINVEGYRNTEWQPTDTVDFSIPPASNR